MASNNDPFLSSVPNLDSSPTMSSLAIGLDDGNSEHYFDSALHCDSPELSFTTFSNSHLADLSSQSHTFTNRNGQLWSNNIALYGPHVSHSSESSPPDSLSGCSVQHQRNGSSSSSHSGLQRKDVTMMGQDQVTTGSPEENVAGIHVSNAIATTKLHGLSFSHSSKDSPPNSLSSSSNQHRREDSSNSSHSGVLGRNVAIMGKNDIAAWRAAENAAEIHSSNDARTANFPGTTDFESSNIIMGDVFDFESAASSPGPTSDSKFGRKTPFKTLKMPYRSSPGSFPRPKSAGHPSDMSKGLHEVSTCSSVHHTRKITSNTTKNLPTAASAEEGSIANPMMCRTGTSPPTFENHAISQHSSDAESSGFHHAAISIPFLPSVESHHLSQTSSLTIDPTVPKSRVETQIAVKMTLFPVPLNIARLHIPVHTVSRPKQVAKLPPKRSPDMLELHVELVCTSAMQDPAKRAKALARAACVPEHERNEESRRLLSGVIPPYQVDDPEKPSNGGCVLICEGCMKRETKRAARKKLVNAEEEALWLPHSGKRIIIFNSPEVKGWEDPSAMKIDPKKKIKNSKSPVEEDPATITEPATTLRPMHIGLQMRIGCYCRHQEEKLGFQVIFTIKDHEDRCIAQAMTNSIMITDDHKTQAASASVAMQNSVHAETAQLPGVGVFVREPMNQFAPCPVRESFGKSEVNHVGHRFSLGSSQNPYFYGASQNLSHTTSTIPIPPNLSRPASPSHSSERQQKRRKGAGSGNLPNELIMTKLNTTDAAKPTVSDPISAGPSDGSSSAGQLTSSLPYSTFKSATENAQITSPIRYHTRPPTPASHENSVSRAEARSQSVDDLTTFRQRSVPFDLARSNRVANLAANPTTYNSRSTSNLSQPAKKGFHSNTNGFTSIVNGSQPAANGFEPTSHGQPHNMNDSQTGENGFQPASHGPQHYTFPHLQSQQPVNTNLHTLRREGVASGVPAAIIPQPQPTIHKLIASEGPKAGGIEVTCLGSGFHPGLQVMFGNTLATTTTFWGESSLVCLLPPATYAGSVPVLFAHEYQSLTPSRQQIYFNYLDDDEPEIIKHALTALVRKFTGRTEGPGEIVRKMQNGTLMGRESLNGYGMGSNNGMVGYAVKNYFQTFDVKSGSVKLGKLEKLEGWLLKCLDLIDLNDSTFPGHLNATRLNGQTMLHLSASLGLYCFAAALLARGVDPDLRDNNGMSPMHMASLNNHSRIVRKLRLAGGDPTLRSLRGYTPADMASTPEMCIFMDKLERSLWPQSARATPVFEGTRASSANSLQSQWEVHSKSESAALESFLAEDCDIVLSSDEDDNLCLSSHAAIKPQPWVRSRRQSAVKDHPFLGDTSSGYQSENNRIFAAVTVWSTWKDQIATQVQQLQQGVHRTLPNLPMPTLPPLLNLPDYQDYPMVKKISSLVPQRYPRLSPRGSKVSDYHWWELLRGTTAPPPYEELYPQGEQEAFDVPKSCTLRPADEGLMEEKRAVNLDHCVKKHSSILNTIEINNHDSVPKQRAEILAAHAMKVKRLRSDRNLFLFWIPLLILVGAAILKDRVPQIWYNVRYGVTYLRGHDLLRTTARA